MTATIRWRPKYLPYLASIWLLLHSLSNTQPTRILEPDSPHYDIDLCQTLPTKNPIFVRIFPTIKNTYFPHKKYSLSRQTNGAFCVSFNMGVCQAFPASSHNHIRARLRIHYAKEYPRRGRSWLTPSIGLWGPWRLSGEIRAQALHAAQIEGQQ